MLQTYRRLILPIYFPTLMTSLVQCATTILLPLYVLELGHSVATASFIIAMRGIGLLIADIPAGLFANRFGDKSSMLVGSCALMLAMILLGITEQLNVIMLAAMLTGLSISFILVGRMSYVTDSVGAHERGRVLALMAGLNRAGALLGPLAFGVVAKYADYHLSFAIMAVLIVLAILSVAIYAIRHETTHRQQHPMSAMFGVVVKYRKVLLSAGLGGLSLMMVRAARNLLFPLVGHGFGLDAVQIGLLFSLSSIIDLLMFYPAGQIMDKKGRKWTAVPGMLIFTLSLAVLPLMPTLNGMLLFALLSGLGNGITTGLLLTIASDVAPDTERGQFLGVWRLQIDIGHTMAPVLLGTLAEIASLAVATLSIVGFGFVGTAIFAFLMQETLESPTPGNK